MQPANGGGVGADEGHGEGGSARGLVLRGGGQGTDRRRGRRGSMARDGLRRPRFVRDAKAGVSSRGCGGGCGCGGGARARGLEERHERIARVLRQEGLGEVQKAGHRARHLPRG